MQAQPQSPNLQTMGGCMFAGDLKISKSLKKSILIIGDTRVGKSTLFNYITDVPLVGYEDQQTCEVVYREQFHQGAISSNSFVSVTLVPNIQNVFYQGEQVSLADMAGFYDQSRSYVGIFGVSFMIEKMLEQVDTFKILLVISHPNFQMGKLEDFIQPFKAFLRILKGSTFQQKKNTEQLDNFMNSISIVVSRAREAQKFYLAKIKRMIDFIEKQEQSEEIRRILHAILKSIYQHERVQIFKNAQDNLVPEKCQILEKLSEKSKNWNFFKFSSSLTRQQLFELPFKTQLQQMKDTQKSKYKNYSTIKNANMKNSYKIIKSFITVSLENWQLEQPINYERQFIDIEEELRFQPYGKFQDMVKYLDIEFIANKKAVTRFQLLKLLRVIDEESKKIDAVIEKVANMQEKIGNLSKHVFGIFDAVRKLTCFNRQQEQRFIIFMFINIRYLYQSQMQNKIDSEQGAQIPFLVKQILCSLTSNRPMAQLATQFYIKTSPKESEKQASQQLKNYIEENLKDLNKQQLKLQYYKILINSSTHKIGIELKKKNYQFVLNQLVHVYQRFKQYRFKIKNKDVEAEDSLEKVMKQQEVYCRFKYLHIMKQTAECMQKLQKYRISTKIYEHINAAYLLNKLYQTRISLQTCQTKKYELILSYIETLIEQNKRQKAQEMYERLLDEFQYVVEERQHFQEQVIKLMNYSRCIENNHYLQRLRQQKQRKGFDEQQEFEIWEDVIEVQGLILHEEEEEQQQEKQGQEDNRDLLFQKRKTNILGEE